MAVIKQNDLSGLLWIVILGSSLYNLAKIHECIPSARWVDSFLGFVYLATFPVSFAITDEVISWFANFFKENRSDREGKSWGVLRFTNLYVLVVIAGMTASFYHKQPTSYITQKSSYAYTKQSTGRIGNHYYKKTTDTNPTIETLVSCDTCPDKDVRTATNQDTKSKDQEEENLALVLNAQNNPQFKVYLKRYRKGCGNNDACLQYASRVAVLMCNGCEEVQSYDIESPCYATVDPDNFDAKVWVNTQTGIFHYPGARWYGNTEYGEYMSVNDALSKGYSPAANNQ